MEGSGSEPSEPDGEEPTEPTAEPTASTQAQEEATDEPAPEVPEVVPDAAAETPGCEAEEKVREESSGEASESSSVPRLEEIHEGRIVFYHTWFFQGNLIVRVIIDGSHIYHYLIIDLSLGHVDDDSAHEQWDKSNANSIRG